MKIIVNRPRMRYFTRVYTICEDNIGFQKTMQFVLSNLTPDPSVYKMDHSDFNVSNYGYVYWPTKGSSLVKISDQFSTNT